jgi:hypothetical protein
MSGADTGAVTLKLRGREFACRPSVPRWDLMRLASAMSSGDTMRGMGAMFDFVSKLIAPEAWPEFDAFMSEAGLDNFDELDNAIGDALAEMGGRGKGRDESSMPSSGGSPTEATPAASRVVSFSRGTVEVEEPNPLDEMTSSTG